jgi:transcription antitermination factor NusA-like protein
MEFPICELCLESERLCESCRKKLEDGSITESSVKISRIVYRIFEKAKMLGGASIKNIVETGSFVLIVCGEDYAEKMSSSDLILKQLSKETGKSVKVVSEAMDMKQLLQSLIEPVPLIGVDVIYTASGEKLRARIPAGGGLHLPEADIKDAIKMIFKKEMEFAQE